MTANELRIGNWVEFNNNGHPVKVKELGEVVLFYNTECYSGYESMNGIPITEKWLLKFGFKFNGWNYDLKHFNIHSQRHSSHKDFHNFIEVHWIDKMIPIIGGIKHVHQLQNLYFALTQEELTI